MAHISQWTSEVRGATEVKVGSAGEAFAIWSSDLLVRMPTVAPLHPLLVVAASLQGTIHESLGIGAEDVADLLARAGALFSPIGFLVTSSPAARSCFASMPEATQCCNALRGKNSTPVLLTSSR